MAGWKQGRTAPGEGRARASGQGSQVCSPGPRAWGFLCLEPLCFEGKLEVHSGRPPNLNLCPYAHKHF